MIERVTFRTSAYYDSVTLMLISRDAGRLEGVEAATAITGTPLNLSLLERQGFDLDGAGNAGPNDLVIAIRAVDEATADAALAAIDARLTHSDATVSSAVGDPDARSLLSATRTDPGLDLAFLSVPGRHVPYEAALALRSGLHVFCFSDGVLVEEEVALKRRAIEHGLLFMGPDCGTAIVGGAALGFANVVDRGPVGLVGASGTGLQQVTCLLDAAGVGISQAIGVGGRDLTAAVGGLMTEHALGLLAADEATEIVVVISKPPDPDVAGRIGAVAETIGKPVVLAFLGETPSVTSSQDVTVAGTLEEAAHAAAALAGAADRLDEAPLSVPSVTGYVRGLFCGGTLCDEAMAIAAERIAPVRSNVPLRPEWLVEDVAVSREHTFIDFGDDAFTAGRAHPMMDPSLRLERFEREAQDPEVGAILLDVVLGHGSHPDPAAALAPAVAEARRLRGNALTVVVSLCGTGRDPQGLEDQRHQLETAGALVVRSNAHAARTALTAIGATEAIA